MAEMKKIVYKKSEERLMVGMCRETTLSQAGEMWKAFFSNGTIEKLDALSTTKCCNDIDPNAGIGMMFDFKDSDTCTLIIGDFVKMGTHVPEELTVRRIPAGKTAHVQIEGANIAEILDSAYFLITEAVEKTGGTIDYEHFYWCEVYTDERYCAPLKLGEKVIIDYIVPIIDHAYSD